jgi:hypothetical protein
MYIAYMLKAREREREKREKQQVGWPEAIVTPDRLSVRLGNRRRRHVPPVAAPKQDQTSLGHPWMIVVVKVPLCHLDGAGGE